MQLHKTGLSLAMTVFVGHVTERAPEGSVAREVERESNPVIKTARLLGPGLITGAAQMDPSAIATYAIAGAALGLAPLWTALYTMPLVVAIEVIADRLGLVARRGLAKTLRRRVPRPVLVTGVLLLAVAATINIGADLGAIGEGMHMLTGLPVQPLTIPAAVLTAVTVVFGSYKIVSNVFKVLTFAFLAYVATVFFVKVDPGEVARATLVPSIALDRNALQIFVAIVGTTMSPYLVFWLPREEQEEKREERRERGRRRARTSRLDIKQSAVDVGAGMIGANLVMFCILLTTAATLHANGKTDVRSGADAAEALRPLLGDLASTLFGAGLIAAGLLAVPVLAGSTAYAVSETFGWRSGINENWRRAPAFYAVFVVATLIGAALNFSGVSPIDALFLASVVMGVISPPLLAATILVARDRHVMDAGRIGGGLALVAWIAVAATAVTLVALVWTLLPT